MLEPQERRQLLDSLRPPSGYSLDFAVGTTYSLDLLALLTAPLAFTFFAHGACRRPALARPRNVHSDGWVLGTSPRMTEER